MKKLLFISVLIINHIALFGQVEQIESIEQDSESSACIQSLSGQIKDRVTNNLLHNANVVLSDKDGNLIESQTVNEDATFSFEVACEIEYRLEVTMDLYTSESKLFTTTNETGKELKLIVLLDKGNIDFLSDPIAEVKVEKVEINIEIPETDIVPGEPIKVIPEKKPSNINFIYFDLGSSYLTKEAKTELQKIVNVLKKNPTLSIECSAHSDAQGTPGYNKWLSDRRTKRTVDYLASKGINLHRVSGKGYGDTQLITNCPNGVQCTEKEHAKNRRVEFAIVNTKL